MSTQATRTIHSLVQYIQYISSVMTTSLVEIQKKLKD